MYRLIPILTLLALLVATARAKTDCSKPFNPKNIQGCCKTPQPKFDAYMQQCPQLKGDRKSEPNPCAIDCLFNASQALQNDQLNMDNVRTMLTSIFPDNADFSQAYALGFEKCEAEAQKKIAELKASGRVVPPKLPGFSNCSPLPVMYSMCANRIVFIECPAAAWTASAVCEQAKQQLANCDPTWGIRGNGGGRKNGRMGRGGGGGAGLNRGAGFRSSVFY